MHEKTQVLLTIASRSTRSLIKHRFHTSAAYKSLLSSFSKVKIFVNYNKKLSQVTQLNARFSRNNTKLSQTTCNAKISQINAKELFSQNSTKFRIKKTKQNFCEVTLQRDNEKLLVSLLEKRSFSSLFFYSISRFLYTIKLNL